MYTENSSQIRERYLGSSLLLVAGDAAFLKINLFTSIFEEVWPQFQLGTFISTYCLKRFATSSRISIYCLALNFSQKL